MRILKKTQMNNRCALCGGTTFVFLFHHHYGWKMQQCANCGLVQVMPRPSREEIAKLYKDDMQHFLPYIEQIPVHREFFRRKVNEIIVFVGSSADKKRLLDVGCAMGILIEEANKAGFRGEGVDISKDAVKYCRNHGLTVYAGTLGTLTNLKKNSYDIVTAFEVIEHEQDPLGMARQVYTILRKGGLAVFGTPDHSGIWRKVMGKHWVGYSHPEHNVLFDPDTITTLLKRAGFKNIEVRRDQPRKFPLYFLFTRGADYLPWLVWLLLPIGNMLKKSGIMNPVNPWDDMIVFARK